MAGISVGEGKSGRRALDHALPLVPFIDFMVCLIAFLIVTAVWTQQSRLNATGQVPGELLGLSPEPQEELHVVASAQGFEQVQGQHRAEGDQKLDRAVLHVQNDAPFSEIVALLDALHAPRRGQASAFDVAFAF